MNPLESVYYLLGMIWKGINWLWGWSLFAEAYFWQFLLNQIKEGKAQEWMIVRSFRTAVAGCEPADWRHVRGGFNGSEEAGWPT